MNILLIFGLVFFVLYNIQMVYLNKGIPESISATSYLCKEKYGTTWPFTLLCIISAVCMFPLWVTLTPDFYQFLVFLSCSGMIMAGCSPLFKEKFEGIIHYTSGRIAFAAGLVWLILMGQWITLGVIGVIGGIWTLFQKDKYTFIFEDVSYIVIGILLLMMY